MVANCAQLRGAWSSEHSREPLRRFRRPSKDIVVRQAEWFEPDVVYVQEPLLSERRRSRGAQDDLRDSWSASSRTRSAARRSRLQRFDLLITSFPHFATRLRARGVRHRVSPPRLRRACSRAPRLVRPGAVRRGVRGSVERSAVAACEPVARAGGRPGRDRLLGLRGAGSWPADVARFAATYHGEAWGIDDVPRCCEHRESPSTGMATLRRTSPTTCGSTRRPGSGRCS